MIRLPITFISSSQEAMTKHRPLSLLSSQTMCTYYIDMYIALNLMYKSLIMSVVSNVRIYVVNITDS